ncbi:amidase family protein [Flavobacteriaceae bacterium S0825]|uniref:amidase family protein n=1 Tax=Gaetbulibacter sp. S0825 TaxID=2720084 RepID=UPI001431C207|nr:amidase family protein [Gaetbulibacter sp. S0825]MCK0110154.1 amidase family protein [Flavobacteriaceae bacterium S0825]NIX65783.1 amidase [Gaetbulibacter sp. S0825]
MRNILYFLLIALVFSCKNDTSSTVTTEREILEVVKDSTDFREFRVLDSRYISKEELWKPFNKDLEDFTEETYNKLKPLVLEQDIPTLQKHITNGDLSYEVLTKFYLYRIRKFDRENELSLNSIIALNPNVIDEAKKADNTQFVVPPHQIFGMPILLKDNINASGMTTTAGAVALQENTSEDAFITERLKSNGALILGKANLSEWAYFFCGDCPSGYSAIGGQTLNPYGRRTMDTGGSSSGSGVSVATNFSVGAVGSETSGSILSPSSSNSIVGLKPTIGLLSRSGIVPISSTLDTPGPMTKNVIDNAIMLDAMSGFDDSDSKAIKSQVLSYSESLSESSIEGKRFGAFKRLMEDSLYANAIKVLRDNGAEVVEVDEIDVQRSGFISLLNLDMKKDLPEYLANHAANVVEVTSVQDVINFNNLDSLNRAPYGQRLFKGIVDDPGSLQYLDSIKTDLKTKSRLYFDTPIEKQNLDGFLSINNFHAGWAATAEYPALTVPMGYQESGRPRGLTFISKPLSEKTLLEWAYVYEQASKKRVPPVNYN